MPIKLTVLGGGILSFWGEGGQKCQFKGAKKKTHEKKTRKQ